MAHRHRSIAFPWERVVGILLACLVIFAFLFYVFSPPESGDATLPIIRFLAAMAAGYSAILFIGTLEIDRNWIKASGGFATVIVVLLLFYGIPTQPGTVPPAAEGTPLESTVVEASLSPQPAGVVDEVSEKAKSVEELISDFRKSLYNWYTPLPKAEKNGDVAPSMDESIENGLTDIINQLNDAVIISDASTLQKARINFYTSFWEDFQRRVLKRNIHLASSERQCERASGVYKSSVNAYLDYYQKGGKITTDEDFFIIIELGHWLINRDAGLDDYVEASNTDLADGYQTALELYRTLDPKQFRNELQYNFYASRGLANAKLRNFPKARKDFESALEIDDSSSDLQYNFASMDAQLANFELAIKGYQDAIAKYENEHAKVSPGEHLEVKVGAAIIYRDLGWAHLLSGIFKEQRPESSGQRDFEASIGYFNQIEQASNFADIAHAGKALAVYYQQGSYKGTLSVKSELGLAGNHAISKYAREITTQPGDNGFGLMSIIKRYAFGHIVAHDMEEDKVLDIFHSYFYCEGNSPRINS